MICSKAIALVVGRRIMLLDECGSVALIEMSNRRLIRQHVNPSTVDLDRDGLARSSQEEVPHFRESAIGISVKRAHGNSPCVTSALSMIGDVIEEVLGVPHLYSRAWASHYGSRPCASEHKSHTFLKHGCDWNVRPIVEGHEAASLFASDEYR